MGTAAAGAVALGAVVGAKSLVPQVTATDTKGREEAGAASKGRPATASGAITTVPASWDYTADVVVVGQGIAGCSAALTAYDAGASVIILDKAPTADHGNSGVCGGLTWYPCNTANGGSLQDFITTVKVLTWGTVQDESLITAYCVGLQNVPNFYAKYGAPSKGAPSVPTAVPRSLLTGLVSPSFQTSANYNNLLQMVTPTGTLGAGVDVMVYLGAQVASRNIPVLQSTPAQSLFQDGRTKEVIGVQAVDWKGEAVNVQANKAVILACGGFENNNEIATNFEGWSHTNAASLSFWGTPYNTGDGIYMAQSVGAKLWHMNNKEWTGSGIGCKAACQELGMGITVGSAVGNATTIIVNRYGRRFLNEAYYSGHTAQLLPYDQLLELNGGAANVAPFDPQYSYLPTNVPSAVTDLVSMDYCDYPNTPFYMIFDSQRMGAGALGSGSWASAKSALHPTPIYTWSPDNSVELAKGWIIGPAATPTALGNMITCYDFQGRVVGMNAAGLAATITQFNTDAAAGKGDTVFGRPAAVMKQLNQPPYYAVELCLGRLNTNGGPQHDKYGRTLDVNNNPIPRLYSIGELGSIFGFIYYGGGNFPEGIVMGQYAGAQAASLPSYWPV